MIITHKIDMHLDMPGKIPRIEAVQGDAYTRIVQFSLLYEGLAWEIPADIRAVIRFLKSDGCGGEYETLPDGTAAYAASGNILEVTLAPEVLTAEGTVLLTVSLIHADTELSTFQIRIDVHANTGARLANSVNYYRSPWLEEMFGNLGQDMAQIRQDVEDLRQDVADLQYVPIDITSISNDVGTAELGSAVNTVTISWTLNKTPASQSVDGTAADPTVRSLTLEDLGLTAARNFTVTVTDERDAVDTAATKINFCNGVYYGVLEDGDALDSAAILGLTRKLQSGKALTFTADAGASRHIACALPARYGTPNFNVGGFDGGFSLAAAISFENASGYTEPYNVWLSDNTGLGSTTVKVV